MERFPILLKFGIGKEKIIVILKTKILDHFLYIIGLSYVVDYYLQKIAIAIKKKQV